MNKGVQFNFYGEADMNESQSFFEPFAPSERSKSSEHSIEERSKCVFSAENENNQKLTKTKENQR